MCLVELLAYKLKDSIGILSRLSQDHRRGSFEMFWVVTELYTLVIELGGMW